MVEAAAASNGNGAGEEVFSKKLVGYDGFQVRCLHWPAGWLQAAGIFDATDQHGSMPNVPLCMLGCPVAVAEATRAALPLIPGPHPPTTHPLARSATTHAPTASPCTSSTTSSSGAAMPPPPAAGKRAPQKHPCGSHPATRRRHWRLVAVAAVAWVQPHAATGSAAAAAATRRTHLAALPATRLEGLGMGWA